MHNRKDLHGRGSCCQPELVPLVYGVCLLPLMQGRIDVVPCATFHCSERYKRGKKFLLPDIEIALEFDD